MPDRKPGARRRLNLILAACLLMSGIGGSAGALQASAAPLAAGAAPQVAVIPQPPRAPAQVMIRVGLARQADLLELGASAAYELLDLVTGALVLRSQGDRSARVEVAAGTLTLNGAPVTAQALRVNAADGSRVSLNGRRYRGEVEVRLRNGRLQALNAVDLEDYLLGVVPREMPPSWHPEALKAQAVAARAYALYQMREGKFRAEGFDVVDTVESQVYGGIAAEDPRASTAVQQTRGEAALFGGQAILAYFHSSSGGHTEHAENVWGKPLPYIRGVPDFDQNSPRYRWQRNFTPDELGAAFAPAGYRVGRVINLEPDGRQGISGRWTRLRLVGSEGSVALPAPEVRKLLGLDSTLFEIVPVAPSVREQERSLESSRTVIAVGADGRRAALPLGQMWAFGATGNAASLAARAAGQVLGLATVPTGLELRGRGFGHGTGLSQWGAKALAERGESYQKIVGYYYQGVALGPGAPAVAAR